MGHSLRRWRRLVAFSMDGETERWSMEAPRIDEEEVMMVDLEMLSARGAR